MFKIESYITPVILSYVEKYVKNFKPEQSQVSLWGGDASFQNLDLRLEVLEEQLNLPFTFVSGHIHELLIHVPWVKITSEPIVVTINTIECILNLKDQGQTERSTTTHQGAGLKAIQEESPPGYIKSIVAKVINNITINCNNLILKYVEEDIVLSVNVRFLSMQTVNELWEPAFTDVSSSEIPLRKIVTVEDLTLCLDKMDTAGKIEMYQDPVLYRCSMIIRLMMNYNSNMSKCASITRFDLHCEKMEFSMSEQQLPMLLRLVTLITCLRNKQPGLRNDKTAHTSDERGDILQDDDDQVHGALNEAPGWSGWAWNVVTSFLPVDWDPDWSDEQQISSTGHVIHMSVYIDEAVLTFKTVETLQEQLFYKSRKIRYNSFLTLRVTSAIMSMLVKGACMSNLKFGLGSIRLHPQGICSCGYQEVTDDLQPPIYLEAGNVRNDYLSDSLFDENLIDNTNWKNHYSEYDIDYHLATFDVKTMLKKSPAFCMDLIHHIEIPDDFPIEKISEFESNFEYSNFPERKITRYVIGDLNIQLCTGLMHRINAVKCAAKYDYSLYTTKKPDPNFDELPPVTVEEYEALRDSVSVIETYFNFYQLNVQFQLTDHSVLKLTNPRITLENRFTTPDSGSSSNAHLSIESSEIVGSIVEPMYAFRLASCASKQADISSDMLNDCYSILNIKISGMQSQLYLNENCHTTIVMPCNSKWSKKTLVFPQYWRQTDVTHDLTECEIDDVTFTGTKAKLMVATSIAMSLADPTEISNPLFCSTLFADACNEKNPVHLELSLENVVCKRIKSSSNVSIKFEISCIKAFALNDTQQAFILSGPEFETSRENETTTTMLTGILQYSEQLSNQLDPCILSFKISEIRSSFDPLLCQWLRYIPIYTKSNDSYNAIPETEIQVVEDTFSDTDVRKKIFRTLHESVHSLSDKEKRRSSSRTDWSKGVSGAEDLTKKIPINEDNELEELQKSGIIVKIVQLYPFWRKLVLCGSIGHFVVYVPATTMDGIGVAGIETAKDRALNGYPNLQIFALKFPTVTIHSVNMQFEKLLPHLRQLPPKLPMGMWSREYHSFPWTLKLNNLSCYTLKKDSPTNVIRNVDLTATIDITTKSTTTEFNDWPNAGLGLCVYIDTSPVIISLSEEQITILNGIFSDMKNLTNLLYRSDEKIIERAQIETEATYFDIPKTPSSYNPVAYPENTTSPSSISTARDSSDQAETESPVITAMIQWTITKMSVKLYTMDETTERTMKLLLELEDIITTFDWQPIYLKFKNKITTATVCHFVREVAGDNWKLGDYAGLIMLGRECSSEQSEDNGFLSVTYTKAQSGNVHTRWGAQKHQKSQKTRAKRDCPLSAEGYITEIDMSLQRIDIILPPSIVNKFLQLLKPFLRANPSTIRENVAARGILRCDNFNNKSLPLIYLEFKGMNLMVPTKMIAEQRLQHDLLMIQLDGIGITPTTENPICRTILRSDIYQMAAQSNILNIPGSSVEDRQYQVNIRGVCACTTTWQNYQQNVPKRTSQSYLYTMNENPALEWNNLASDGNLEPQFSTSLLMSRIDVRLIIAPAVVLKPSKIICGGAFELTCLTDIEIAINIDQIKLMCQIYNEINTFLSDYTEIEEIANQMNFEIPKTTMTIVTNTNEIQGNETDLTGDSGIDFESSSVNYVATRKIPINRVSTPLPLEILVNCGSVTISLMATTMEVTTNTSEPDENLENNFEYIYFHVTMTEPNIYISQLNEKEKIQISCFDVAVSLRDTSDNEESPKSRKLPLIETKSGTPHPDTGIPPSFVVIKCEKNCTTSTRLFIDIGRPTKINFSIIAIKHIDRIRELISGCFFMPEIEETCRSRISHSNPTIESNPSSYDIPELGLRTKQIVLSLSTDSGSNVSLSVARSSGNTSRILKTEKSHGNINLESFVISVKQANDDDVKIILKPSSFRAKANVFWENWQNHEEDPQIMIQAHSDIVYFEFGPRKMKILESIVEEYYILVNYLKLKSTTGSREARENKKLIDGSLAEQNYKDDLKAGAFQFVNGNAEEMPSAYQVVFHTYPEMGMAWKYPQPRIISGLHVSPGPFEISDDVDLQNDPITCSLEYWSDGHGTYRRYIEFNLSETENYHPDLPSVATSQAAVASTWRVVVSTKEKNHDNTKNRLLAPQLLVGCLQIDSYFNATIVPNLRVALNIGKTKISIFNHVKTLNYENLPYPLARFSSNGLLPESQCFIQLEHTGTAVVLNGWSNDAILIDISGNLDVRILDYGLLHMQEFLRNLESNVQISISTETNVTFECNPFNVKFGPSIAHTLAVSTNIWLDAFDETNNSEKYIALLTRVIVANDSNVTMKFGQCGTNDVITLPSRQCHFYCWRSAFNRNFRLAIESTEWHWSQPFNVNKTGKQLIIFGGSGKSSYPIICAKIELISATQKLVTFSGLLVVTNRLVESFQMKLVPLRGTKLNGDVPIVTDNLQIIGGNEQPASIILENRVNMAMRLRFATSTSLSWTGDIPLRTNSKFGQPWLVKVPLQDRGQFLSIWVRIVEENIHGETRILVVMSPLYMIKSYLPVPVVIKIDTPSLSMSSNATINGQGKCQQLYCPGTFEHCHQLTFQFESGMSSSNPYVPLSYSSIEERTFFARPRNEDIDEILQELENSEKNSYLPFKPDNSNIQISADQPQTHVQIKYRDAGLVSSTLLLELQPWCFIFNTLGCHISIFAENTELCQVPHNGIVTPPKLEGTFHLRVTVENNDYVSPALQLARPDWNPGFYMPRIRGLVPVDGNIQASIECGSNICAITINSRMHEDMRIVRIMASHVICNFTNHEFHVACLVIAENSSGVKFPNDRKLDSIVITPSKDRTQGIPIVQWRMIGDRNNLEHEALYVSLSNRGFSWSCPVRVDKKSTSRRCLAVSDHTDSIPVVVTTQEDDGSTYIIIHPDDHPQLYIENLCPFPILLGEANLDEDGICQESFHFTWRFEVESGKSCYYYTPSVAKRMPDCQTTEPLPKLRLSALPYLPSMNEPTADNSHATWSRPIAMSNVTNRPTEQYVRLPIYGDIKLSMMKRCHTICLRVVCMSQVEVSAHDIRTRLIHEEGKSPDIKSPKSLRYESHDDLTIPTAEFSCPTTSSIVQAQQNTTINDEKNLNNESPNSKSLRGSLNLYIRGINVMIMQDTNESAQRVEVASLCLSDLIILIVSNERSLTLCACVGDLQLDNQMFEQGGFDFPVVFMSQRAYRRNGPNFCAKSGSRSHIAEIENESLILVDCSWEVNVPIYACTNVNVKIGPVSAYIEDTFVTQLLEYTTSTTPPCFNATIGSVKQRHIEMFPNAVSIPEYIIFDSTNLRTPLRLEKFTIEPISLLASVHTSIRLYVALDHSPMYFGAFERHHLSTTPGGLANALTMHYLSGALFGAGWVVGSLEILGSPGGFAQALGNGLKDFVTLPIQGILRGPWSFLIGVTQGSASLMKHVTAGTVNSVTKLASSVARNLDRLTLDDEHLQRQEESRRTRPQGMAQGLYQGLTGFGMSLLAAVAGLAHNPLQQVLTGVATPRGLVTGVGLGIVGAVTKPLSGAAELVALTGQGLLEGTGWNPLPTPRQRPIVETIDGSNNSSFKCVWHLLSQLTTENNRILHIADAMCSLHEEIEKRVTLILTRKTLVVANVDENSVEKCYSLRELTIVEHISDSTMICLYCREKQTPPERTASPIEYPEMDQAMRTRVEQFVRGSSTGCTSYSTNAYQQTETIEVLQTNPNNTLTFYIEPEKRNYFLSLFETAKRQDQGSDFVVL